MSHFQPFPTKVNIFSQTTKYLFLESGKFVSAFFRHFEKLKLKNDILLNLPFLKKKNFFCFFELFLNFKA